MSKSVPGHEHQASIRATASASFRIAARVWVRASARGRVRARIGARVRARARVWARASGMMKMTKSVPGYEYQASIRFKVLFSWGWG